MRSMTCLLSTVTTLWALIAAVSSLGADWPAFRHDGQRSGVTVEELPPKLSSLWVHKEAHAPAPAWGVPQTEPVEDILELPRVRFDDAYQVAVAGDLLYFGSSSDDTVCALDADSGKLRWRFVTGGPVRLAPTVVGGLLYVGSDDGAVYCLRADSGKEVWRFRAAPTPERLLGHGRMISLWPIRTGVLVDNGTAYFGAGLFPSEGICLYAVDAADGSLVWRNDTFGRGGLKDISPQGYLLCSATTLFMPSGRGTPAAFARADGHFLFQPAVNRWREGTYGGVDAVLSGRHLYNGTEQIVAFDAESGRPGYAWLHGRHVVLTDDSIYLAGFEDVAAFDQAHYPAATRARQDLKHHLADLAKRPKELAVKKREVADKLKAATRWRLPGARTGALILAGKLLIAGGDDEVTGIDAASGQIHWTQPVEGRVRGLAVAAQRLFVSTDSGRIYAFGGRPPASVAASEDKPVPTVPTAAAAARKLVQETGIKRGYALLIGDTGQLALALARASDLYVYVTHRDQRVVDAARDMLLRAGVYGDRVSVDHCPTESLPYSDYFANLIVELPDTHGQLPVPCAELVRMLKPLGGVACVGAWPPESATATRQTSATLKDWISRLAEPSVTSEASGDTCIRLRRGALAGAGSWTHQYGEPGNTACGDDELVACPLGLLWFGEPGPEKMVNRHVSAAAPLSMDGRLFVQGRNILMAYDAYNGLALWERHIPGAMRTGLKTECSNIAASGEHLFVATGRECLRLDPVTGRTTLTVPLPGADSDPALHWGYVAYAEGLLYGTATNAREIAGQLFGIDAKTGAVRWQHSGRQIMHATIAVGGNRIYFVEKEVTEEERSAVAATEAASRADRRGQPAVDARAVVSLDAATGKRLWRRAINVADCVKISKAGGELSTIYRDGVLLLFGAPWNGHFWNEFFAGEFSRRSLIALNAADGRQLWSTKAGYRSRPLVVGDTIYAEPWARDLHSGESRMRNDPITGVQAPWQMSRPGHHCGCLAASPNCLFFRSGSIGYYDLAGDSGTAHFGGVRPGCWINFIPANGLLLVPEASSGCVCPFPIHCTLAFKHRDRDRAWTVFSSPEGIRPIARLGINFGAPGDRRDAEGTVWLAYPRPRQGRLVLNPSLVVATVKDGGYANGDPLFGDAAKTPQPWLYASGCQGLLECLIPVVGDDDPPGLYTARMQVSRAPDSGTAVGPATVKLQGHAIGRQPLPGAGQTAVWEFKDVEVLDNLKVEVTGPGAKLVVNGLEVERTKMFPLAAVPPRFVLNDGESTQTLTVNVTNHTDTEIRAQVEAVSGEPFRVTAAPAVLTIPPRGQQELRLTAAVLTPGAPTDVPVSLSFRRGDEMLSRTRAGNIHYTGPVGELRVPCQADVYTQRRQGNKSLAAATVMWSDGGAKKMGDSDHSLVYFHFAFKLPGHPLGVRLRLPVSTTNNAQSNDAGNLHLVTAPWEATALTYAQRPEPGPRIGKIGRISRGGVAERELSVDLTGRRDLSVVIVPTSTDGAGFCSSESDRPPELIITYRIAKPSGQ